MLTPQTFHTAPFAVHIELGDDIYQFHDDGRLNIARFNSAYEHASRLFNALFEPTDDITLVVNSYPASRKTTYPNVFKRYVKTPRNKYALRLHEFTWTFDGEDIAVQQMSLRCHAADIRSSPLLRALIHEDFRSLTPQLRNKHAVFSPDVFFVNERTHCIFHVYDDRGCEVMSMNEAAGAHIAPLLPK
ncbi:MAG: hypothetical protein UHX00_10540 [Caryophanon sp.]|nr:hypothetical protein [Caryophanon sp.]